MEALYLADQDGQNALHLHGSSVIPPVVGARRQNDLHRLPGGLVKEVIELALRGSTTGGITVTLEERLMLCQHQVRESFLFLQAEAGQAPVSARILSGRIELLSGGLEDRKRGVQILRLFLIREDCWEGDNCALDLSNQNGTDVWDGLTIRNHCDATSGHQNFVDIRADDAGGTQPCPVQVRMNLPAGFGSTLLDCFISAHFDLWDAYSSLNHVLEGEAGSPGSGCSASSTPPDSSCSAGSYAHVEWSAQSETVIWKWTLTPAQLGYMRGCPFRPLMRLASLPAEGIYLRWRIPNHSGAGELLCTQQALLDPDHHLAPLPVLRLPPERMGGGPYEPLEIQLSAECAIAGTKSLDIDFVQLLPAGSFQHLHPLGGLGAGYTLVSDGREKRVYAFQTGSGGQHVSHLLTGSPILLQPGRNNRIYFLYETAAGAPVDSFAQVMVYQRPRVQQP